MNIERVFDVFKFSVGALAISAGLVVFAQTPPAKVSAPTGVSSPSASTSDLLTVEQSLRKFTRSQRDFLLAKSQFEAAAQAMQAATTEADTACGKIGKQLSPDAAECADKPKTAPVKSEPPPK
jgi:hypothetical protein